jgi:hypothetical protein
VVVAFQVVTASSDRAQFVAQADIPTVAPGVDALAGIAEVPIGSEATTTVGMRSAMAGPTTSGCGSPVDAPSATVLRDAAATCPTG